MFRFNKKEQETIPDKPKLLICECGNDMFRNVVKVRLTSPPSTDWGDWYFECNKCGEIYNQKQLSRLTKMAKEMDEQDSLK